MLHKDCENERSDERSDINKNVNFKNDERAADNNTIFYQHIYTEKIS